MVFSFKNRKRTGRVIFPEPNKAGALSPKGGLASFRRHVDSPFKRTHIVFPVGRTLAQQNKVGFGNAALGRNNAVRYVAVGGAKNQTFGIRVKPAGNVQLAA